MPSNTFMVLSNIVLDTASFSHFGGKLIFRDQSPL